MLLFFNQDELFQRKEMIQNHQLQILFNFTHNYYIHSQLFFFSFQVYNFIKDLYPPHLLLPPKLQKLLRNMPHPGGGCFIAVLWLHPAMTFDRMILATVLTAYLCCGYGVTEGDYVYVRQYSASKYTRSVKTQDTKTYYLRGGSHAF